ncbi:DUF3048 domain-containing protein [Heyndrickxia sp. NPDC080065]|uniref:DUF3048 domain-containing protein n=1 Tax=Heyndrickxia sp. NPDC080065 TaxID=3390568 RepID=UPI003D0343BC
MVKRMFIMALLLMSVLSACSHNEKTNSKDSAKAPERGEVSGIEKEKPKFIYPLTGLPAKEVSNDRAVAVMINNHPLARPQSGLTKADIVYEVLAEGDITRFLAIFQSEKPKRIGPIRSSRDYFIELAKGYDSLYIAHGYSPEAKKMLESGYIDNLNGMQYDGTLFKRSSDRQAPHNSYITFENILKGAEQKNFKMDTAPQALSFAAEDEINQISGQKVNHVSVSYSNSASFNVDYQYDEELKKFKRFSANEQTVDKESKKPVLLDNLLIVEMEHKIIDNYGRRAINLTSGGKAYFVQRGFYREIEWKNVDGKIIPYENGIPAKFVPGKTWINIVPNLKDVSFAE